MAGKAGHTSQSENNSPRYAEIQPIISCQEKEINIFIGILTCSTEISGQTVLIICASVQSVVVHVSASGLSD